MRHTILFCSKKFSFITALVVFAFFVSLLLPVSFAASPKPGPNYIWIAPHKTNAGTIMPGFWKLKTRKGYKWVKGHLQGGKWIMGHWLPIKPAPRGKKWVPGHVGKNGRWIIGHYRPNNKKGFIWIPAHRTRRGWVKGHWRRK